MMIKINNKNRSIRIINNKIVIKKLLNQKKLNTILFNKALRINKLILKDKKLKIKSK